MREKIECELERLQSEGVIPPVEFNDWASLIVPVLKGDGAASICGDYKVTINRLSMQDQYPLPKADDLFLTLAGGKSFTKLDLTSAYMTQELDEESRKLTCINTHKGLFIYNRCPFGIRSAAAIFQRNMESLLKAVPKTVVFQDDILIVGCNTAEHLSNLEEVLRCLDKVALRLKHEKCVFMGPKVVFLSRRVTAAGIMPCDSKVEAIKNTSNQENVSQ